MTNSRPRSIRRCGGATLFAVVSLFGLIAVAAADTITAARHAPRWPRVDANRSPESPMMSLLPPLPVMKDDGDFRSDHKCGFWDGLVGN
jgi:hypothetical protein